MDLEAQLKRRACQAFILFCFLWLACSHAEPTIPFDPNIKGLNLVELIEGADAIEAINKLHGMPIDVLRGYIAHYEGVNSKATVWVSEAATEDLAKEQIDVMIDKMKNNRRSPFRRYRAWEEKGKRIIAFDGMGQVHYVFKDDRWVYWISADGGHIGAIFEHICKTG